MRSIRSVGWPTPTGTPWPFLPQVPMPVSSARSLPIMVMRCRSVGPLPISMAPFKRRADLAVLDLVGLGALEHVFARGDVDLAAAEIRGVDAVLHRGENLGGIALARQHVGVGHARHRHMGIALAAAVAGRLHVHQPGVLAVLHVADQDAVLDQHGAVGRRALVVDRQRAAPRGMVPSSTTVTPLAATCWPIRPANAEVCLRLKSPSRP